jgi:hypothetical protein
MEPQRLALQMVDRMRQAQPDVPGWDELAKCIARIVPPRADPTTSTAQQDAQDYHARPLELASHVSSNWAAWQSA